MTNEQPRGYRLVDSDAHINEPPDLWTSRVPMKFHERVPRIEHFEQGDAWVGEGARDPITFGNNISAPFPRWQRKSWVRWEDVPKGGYIPSERLKEMDMDLVDAAVLYPTPRVSQLVIANKDPELHLAMVRAYNDWLSEYCGHDPSRLGAIILVPNRGVAQAVAEIERCAGRPGVMGALVGCYPHGDLDLSAADDPVWRALVAASLPLHIHVRLDNDFPEHIYSPERISQAQAMGDFRFLQSPMIMSQFISGGVFDRIPELRVVLAEVDAGWVPYVKEQMDNRFRRRAAGGEARLKKLPSEYVAAHFYYTYITDHVAIRNRDTVGVDRLMWSSDYPHSGSDWPDSWVTIDADFAGVPAAERDLILAGNALRLYHFDRAKVPA
jgi:predicted TIM-barrel fold metal-dependent hydrolase